MQNVLVKRSFKLFEKIKPDAVLIIAFFIAVFTSFIKAPKLEYIDFRVIMLLFNLMIVVKALEEIKVMDKIAISLLYRYKSFRRISFVLTFITFFASMFVTNDVALLTFIPLTLIVSKKADENFMKTVIFQTLAANIGSSLTPMGNPQNLFLFTHYNISAYNFFMVMLPMAFMGVVWLIALNFRIHSKKLNFDIDSIEIEDKKRLLVYLLLFFIIILSVFSVINYKIATLITLAYVIVFDRQLLKKVDYLLLVTFICFFISIGNISHMNSLHSFIQMALSSKLYTYISSIALSQFISNVPCAILVSEFTRNWREVLLGVNIGGMGTLVASLASVISYKLYTGEASKEDKSKYLLKFSVYNFVSLLAFGVINYFIFI